METWLIWLGGVIAALALYPFTAYPAILAVLSWLRSRPLRPDTCPTALGPCTVALCVCAHNEANVIRAKVENMLAMRSTMPGLELLVYVDGATDRTTEILAEYTEHITIIVSAARRGKTHGMNTLVETTRAEFVVFSDANVTFAPDAVTRLLQPFVDPSVGCVCGHLVYTMAGNSGTSAIGSLYWRLEEQIKELESRIGSVIGADGSIFAIRRALHQPPPPDIIDDMYVSLAILCGGHRVVRAADALAFEAAVSRPREEFRRKVRITCQGYNVHRCLRLQLRQLSRLDQYKYVSHKLLRWFTAYLLAAAGTLVTAGLVASGDWWTVGLGLVAIGLLALAAWLQPAGPGSWLFDIGSALIASALGVLLSLRGERFQIWTPPESARLTTRSMRDRT